ncbi:holo-ACP synthase [Campylobacter hyointestinalis]|uniref:Holo-[acyl-carrier-protein] synthase n=1 Tax=Campylobacter hyointestinalis subsp. lawsonii TaxID=91353 RepID=A0AAV6EET2_CAMHY|nr:holo-ACP synthase [Campylobacter hyointestinalis]ANE34171.1 holo-(acyl-carrier-protein) synthase [Campylobacter hyointestinalis subsp. lawsonii CCUG 27631]KAB0612777.1 holo-ACP synthase [Campylobacter hyointestinalis subsp. lawsonii]QKF69604.1 holo-(acyl-carrier-protein) synthase [Campylobacter hyointestinalis subsp. lawsonii]RAZ26532.1 holo-ACP synthase [Campylobacter hyointestinalis subsp. lawsonii]RAZ29398.1 holo-ACP synthase [Campylobacter hyointestinalis subsp. lawsonii]
MIGIDIIKIDRITKAKSKFEDKFLSKFLSSNEIQIAKNDASLAGFWAAKEAVSKALGCGICAEFGFLDVEIYKDNKGAPKLKFEPNVIHKFGIKNSSLSITHDGGFAIAAVIIEN